MNFLSLFMQLGIIAFYENVLRRVIIKIKVL